MGVMRKFLNWYGRLGPSHGKTLPPYEHVVQVGDPTLRKVSELVPIPSIKSESVQKVIKKLECVLDKYGSLGMSAPQIGVNMRIFVMKHTNKQISYTPKEIVKSRGMSAVPFTVSYNSEGEITSKIFKDWPARIAQHEIDHLDGKLYIDRMDRKTFSCTCWEEVNLSKGKLVIPFHPE
ncbi:uncharacterized protein LOC131847371 isoform X2 [Achroia grisella]|uniref:uncharacterized protein LOC131847371 isoform X2 n=1 Tax=Achroia grisella TaxID=688607 RepID=UPI0027D2458D|nr:uncharacterized protein LOC131847371 isoform X2 [Achroia grisella]